MDDEDEKKKEIDVVSGDGSEIEISPVYDHIILEKPNKNEKKENIVIQKEKKEKEKEKEKEKDTNNNNNT